MLRFTRCTAALGVLRMTQWCYPQGRLLRELEAFLAEASQEGYVPLPDLAARALSFQSNTHALVYDALMQKVLPLMSRQPHGHDHAQLGPSFL